MRFNHFFLIDWRFAVLIQPVEYTMFCRLRDYRIDICGSNDDIKRKVFHFLT